MFSTRVALEDGDWAPLRSIPSLVFKAGLAPKGNTSCSQVMHAIDMEKRYHCLFRQPAHAALIQGDLLSLLQGQGSSPAAQVTHQLEVWQATDLVSHVWSCGSNSSPLENPVGCKQAFPLQSHPSLAGEQHE